MNAKSAKKLRRAARAMTEGLPASGYLIEKQRTARVIKTKDGGIAPYEPQHGIVHPMTTRCAYLKLKRAHA